MIGLIRRSTGDHIGMLFGSGADRLSYTSTSAPLGEYCSVPHVPLWVREFYLQVLSYSKAIPR